MSGGSRLGSIAVMIGAVLLSGAAITDWVVDGVPETGAPAVVMNGVHFLGYLLLLPGALALLRDRGADLGRLGRAAAVVLVVSFAAMSLAFLGLATVGETGVVGLLAGVGFLGMFLAAAVLGVLLWRRTASRLAAALLMAPLPLLAVLLGLEAVDAVSSHPALMEAAVYLGLATLAFERLVPAAPADSTAQAAGG